MPMNTMFVRRWPFGGEPARGVADLVDDLGGLEVAPEPELAGGAERAADRAAGLARDAQRVALARGAAGRVVHQDGLDERAVVESVEGLLGLAAVGEAQLRVRRPCRAGSASSRASRSAAGSVRTPSASTAPPSFQTASAIWRARYAGLALGRHPRGQLPRA